uniref:Uncharacterized protein n=1 Tax=Anguilla anguilla TaxID=7936 RepID=A0A0E9VLG6_ANGAN
MTMRPFSERCDQTGDNRVRAERGAAFKSHLLATWTLE